MILFERKLRLTEEVRERNEWTQEIIPSVHEIIRYLQEMIKNLENMVESIEPLREA